MENAENKLQNARLSGILIRFFPDIKESIAHADYVKELKKSISEFRKQISNYSTLDNALESSKTISQRAIKSMGEDFELFIHFKRAYYGTINEFFQVTRESFSKDEYYYFIIENSFTKIEKKEYEADLNETAREESSFYI